MSKTVEQLREELIQALSTHDWYYGYSDVYSQWAKGNAENERIRDLVKQIPDGETLYAQYQPKQNGGI